MFDWFRWRSSLRRNKNLRAWIEDTYSLSDIKRMAKESTDCDLNESWVPFEHDVTLEQYQEEKEAWAKVVKRLYRCYGDDIWQICLPEPGSLGPNDDVRMGLDKLMWLDLVDQVSGPKLFEECMVRNALKLAAIQILSETRMTARVLAFGNAQTQSNEQWINTTDVKPQPNRVSRLNHDQLERVKKLKGELDEVVPWSLEKWVDGFERDRNPEQEILVWESIATAYRKYVSTHTLSPQAKHDVINVFLLRSQTESESQIIQRAGSKVLTPAQVKEVIADYKGNAKPVEVAKKS